MATQKASKAKEYQRMWVRKLSLGLMASLLVACGGEPSEDTTSTNTDGGKPLEENAPAQSNNSGRTSMRVSRIEHDFDNNGIVDMTTTYTYSADAREVKVEATYQDDGTPDKFTLGGENYINTSIMTLSFSEKGEPLSIKVETPSTDNTSSIMTTSYAYTDNGLIKEIAVEQTATNDSVAVSHLTPEYTDGVLSALTFDEKYGGGGLFYTYHADGSLATIRYGNDTAPLEIAEFSWRADNQLEGINRKDRQGANVASLNTTYSEDGLLITTKYVDSYYPDSPTHNYTANLSWDTDGKLIKSSLDPHSTGTVQATESYRWETGPCYSMYTVQYGYLQFPSIATKNAALFPLGVFGRMLGCFP